MVSSSPVSLDLHLESSPAMAAVEGTSPFFSFELYYPSFPFFVLDLGDGPLSIHVDPLGLCTR